MKKNIPITARISRGLFGQKATEPVLNVGQAGAYNNNVTKGDPSPAKMMQSPLKQMKSESAGDKILRGQASVSTISTIPGEYVAGEKGGTANTDALNKQKVYRKELEGYGLRNPKARAAANKAAAEAKAKDAESGTEGYNKPAETTEKIEPLEIFNEGSAKAPWQRRWDTRSVTSESRKKKRADIQLAKISAEEQGLTGSEKKSYVEKASTQAKKEMWEARKKGYEGSRDAAVLQAQQSAKIGDKIYGTNLDSTKAQPLWKAQLGGMVGKGQYEDIASGTTKTKVEETANVTKETAKETANKKEIPSETSTESTSASTKITKGTLEEHLKTAATKTIKKFFAKKSPLKAEYFK